MGATAIFMFEINVLQSIYKILSAISEAGDSSHWYQRCENTRLFGGSRSVMLIDLSPLRKHRDFRLLFIGQLVSFLGSMVSYMAVPALSLQWGDARMTGMLFSSMAIGSLIATVLSGWSHKVHRRSRGCHCGRQLGMVHPGRRPACGAGGVACVIAVVATSLALPKFWAYRAYFAAAVKLE
jgi:hypothetical protein